MVFSAIHNAVVATTVSVQSVGKLALVIIMMMVSPAVKMLTSTERDAVASSVLVATANVQVTTMKTHALAVAMPIFSVRDLMVEVLVLLWVAVVMRSSMEPSVIQSQDQVSLVTAQLLGKTVSVTPRTPVLSALKNPMVVVLVTL